MPWPYLYLILSLHAIHALATGHNFGPDALARKQEAVPSTCVGGARPCAGSGAARFRSAVPQRPRQVRANHMQVRPCTAWLAGGCVLGRCSSGARGATAVRAGALEPPVNELTDITSGCYPSSKAADAMPKVAPTILHTRTAACRLAEALEML
jgi:hypothetical protein